MVKLPTKEDLPIQSAQPSLSVSTPTAGIEAAENLRRISSEAAQAFGEQQQKIDTFEYATAKSNFLTQKLQAQSDLMNSADWQNSPSAFSQKMAEIKNTAIQGIRNPALAAQFNLDADAEIARGSVQIAGMVRQKQNQNTRSGLQNIIDSNVQGALSSPSDSAQFLDATSEAIDGAVARGAILPEDATKLKRGVSEEYGKGWLKMQTPQQIVSILGTKKGDLNTGKTNTPADFVDIDDRSSLLAAAKRQIHSDEVQARVEQNQAHEEWMDKFSLELFNGSAGSADIDNAMKHGAIKNAAEATMLQNIVKHRDEMVNGGDAFRSDYGFGIGFNYMLARTLAPETMSGAITNQSGLLPHVGGRNSQLTRAGFSSLQPFLALRGSPHGEAELSQIRSFMNAAHSQISAQSSKTNVSDPEGEVLFQKFSAVALPEIEKRIKAGQPVSDLFDPKKTNYLGLYVQNFKRSNASMIKDMLAAAPPLTYSNPQQLMNAYKTGAISREQANRIAAENGWNDKPQQGYVPTVPTYVNGVRQ